MREFKYNVIDLISYVRDRPCLWDKTIENYKDRVERRSAWEEIFNNLEESYEDMTAEEKRITGEVILNKWTNIRDTFIKSLKTKMGRPKKKYLLYNYLEFLTKIIPEDERHKEMINSRPAFMKQEDPADSGFRITTEIEPESSTSFTISNVTSYNAKKNVTGNDFDDTKSPDYTSEVSYGRKSRVKRKSNRFIFADDESVSSRKKSKKGTANDVVSGNDQINSIDFVEVDDNDPRIMNEDEAFFASLLPTVVKYSEDERLEFRIEVLGLMKKLREKRTWMAE